MKRLGWFLFAFLVAGATARAASITVSPTSLAFGGSQIGTPVQKDLTVTNQGNQPFSITSAQITLDAAEFSLVNPPAFPAQLPPNVSFPLTVQFQPSQNGQRMGTLVLTTNDAQANTITVPLTGCAGPSSIALDAQTLIFPSTNLGATSTPSPITITNAGCADLDVNAITVGGANAGDFTLDPMMAIRAIPTGASQKFAVSFAPTLVGQRTATVTIASNDPNAPSKLVSVFGTGTTSMLTLAPQQLDFGDAHFGTRSNSQNLTVGNVGSGTLHVMGVTFSGANATAFLQAGGPAPPFTVGPNAQVMVGVACRPDTLGPLAATVTVTTDVGQAQAQLACNGIAPKIAVTPNTVDFGQVPLTTTSMAKPVAVANMGTDDLHVMFVGIAGPDAGDFSSMDLPQMPIVIQAGMSATFHVAFAPSNHAAETANLQLMTDDPMAATVLVPLTGSGVQSGITVNVMTIDFGTVPLGAASGAKPVKITNAGDLDLTVDSLTLAGGGANNFSVDNHGPFTIAPGMSQTVNLAFAPLSVGNATAKLTIAAQGLAPVNVALSGAGVGPSLGVTPMAFDFGPVDVGNTSTAQAITLKNGGTIPLTLQAIAGASNEFPVDASMTTLMLAPGASTSFTVKFAPASEGMKSGRVSLVLVGQSVPVATVMLAGTGVIVKPRGCAVGGAARPFALAPLAALLLTLLLARRRMR